jgi:mRNA interferase MazF
MRRADLYRVRKGNQNDPKKTRVFVVVSRQVLIDSELSTVICAPVHSSYDGLATQVQVAVGEGLKHESSIHCDGLVSLPKSMLTDFIGRLNEDRVDDLNHALEVSLGLR